MKKNKIDRTGERSYNNFGSEMVIIEYRGTLDIDIYFPEYNWTFNGATYNSFKNGNVKCPYEPKVCGIGYIGEGKYRVSKNGKNTKVYDTWRDMLKRCYDEKHRGKNPSYIDCKVDKNWHNFQNFAKWYEDNYYEVESERMHLDKDILVKHNKVYSPDTCIFVPQTINLLFVKRDKSRGVSLIGTSPFKNGKYRVDCQMINPETGKSKNEYLGYYETQQKGFEVYKYYKERNIKRVADYYKEQIPSELYNAMYNYEVEIDD